MKRRLNIIASLLCLAAPLAASEARAPSPRTEDEGAVRRAVEKLVRDFNARDAQAVMSNFADDVLLASPHHADVDYKTMDEGFARAYAEPPPTPPYRVVIKVEEVEVSGDLAFVRLMWLRESKGDGRILRREKDFEIWRRQRDGRWKLARGYSFTFEGDFPVAARDAAAAPKPKPLPRKASAARRKRRSDSNDAEDARAVKSALENLLRAYNRRDLGGAMAAYTPDSLLSYHGAADSDYDHSRAAYARRFAAPPPSPVTISFRLEELRTSGDLAFARLLWLVERDSDKKTLSRHKDLEVWKRQPDGSWRLYRGLSFHLQP